MKRLFICMTVLLTICSFQYSFSAEPADSKKKIEKRFVYLGGNLYVDETIPRLEEIIKRAKNAGYNGIMFTDYKTAFWWKLDSSERWKKNAEKLRKIMSDNKMELVVCVFPFGRANALLYHDVNLAAGMPVKDAPLISKNGKLVPVQTAEIKNGSFEDYSGDKIKGYSFQDDPGESSFIDKTVFKEGKVSLRFEDVVKNNKHGNGRVCQEVKVKPWQQYRLRIWMKTENLTSDDVKLMVMADGRIIQWQQLKAKIGKDMQYISSVNKLTTDWVEQSVTFNSMDYDKVLVYAGLWGAKDGKIWWDDLRIDSAPVLNVLRRESLPVTITGDDGTVYEEGKDYEKVVDPKLGNDPWNGSYNTTHEMPEIKLTPKSRIKEGQTVKITCADAVIILDEQVNCSLAEQNVYSICSEEVIKASEALKPDGFMMSHDEMRCFGWEPMETKMFKTSGELLAFNIKTCSALIRDNGKRKTAYVWSDMFDPNHNAVKNYYLVNNTIEKSWEGLDKDVVIVKWCSGGNADKSMKFFSDRGNRQIMAAFYDGDVEQDHKGWMETSKGVSNVIGVMYTTWCGDYTKLEKFAEVWWGTKAEDKEKKK